MAERDAKLGVVFPSRYYRWGGKVWTTSSYDYRMWSEALSGWNEVHVAAPCIAGPPPAEASRVDGSRVTVVELSNSTAWYGALATSPRRLAELRRLVRLATCLVLHVPSDLGLFAWVWARWFMVPYALDVRGSQSLEADYLRRRGVIAPRLWAQLMRMFFRRIRAAAIGAVYVSRDLQRRFPVPESAVSEVISDLRLPEWWAGCPRTFHGQRRPFRFLVVGRLDPGKNVDLILKALAQVKTHGMTDFEVLVVGDGPEMRGVQRLVSVLGLSQEVVFRGFVPWGRALYRQYRDADLLLFASATEGLPRVVLEAMAAGLPILSSRVGGTPEVLSAEQLVDPLDPSRLANRMMELLRRPGLLARLSKRNLERAGDFSAVKLKQRKVAFYTRIRRAVEGGANGLVRGADSKRCDPSV